MKGHTTKTSADLPTRPYRSTRRQRQAEQTRADVLDAAVQLFAELGWSGTTIAAVARNADVAVETVYSGFQSKKGLLRAAMDVAVVGDAEPVAFADRPDAAALGTGTLGERLALGARLTADIHVRSIGVWQAILEAAASDAEIDTWRAELEAGRRIEVARSLERIAGRSMDDGIIDVGWVILGPESYLSLTRDLGLDQHQYEARIADALGRLIAA